MLHLQIHICYTIIAKEKEAKNLGGNRRHRRSWKEGKLCKYNILEILKNDKELFKKEVIFLNNNRKVPSLLKSTSQ